MQEMNDQWGQELIPLTENDWKQNPTPRKMYVWNKDNILFKGLVIAYITHEVYKEYPVSNTAEWVVFSKELQNWDEKDSPLFLFDYCAEILPKPPEPPKKNNLKRLLK